MDTEMLFLQPEYKPLTWTQCYWRTKFWNLVSRFRGIFVRVALKEKKYIFLNFVENRRKIHTKTEKCA